MSKCSAWFLMLLLAGSATAVLGGHGSQFLPLDRGWLLGQIEDDAPVRPIAAGVSGGGADTVSYGDFGPGGFSILDDVWDWDNPATGPACGTLMGWYATDLTTQSSSYGRTVTASGWGGHDNEVPAPVLAGTGSLWIGAWEDEADGLCWTTGLGYGNDWCQRAISPVITLTSPLDVTLDFVYFNDTELGFDFTKIIVRRLPGGEETPLNPALGLTGKIGLAPGDPPPAPTGAAYAGLISLGVLQGSTQFQLIFQVESDRAGSDEDGGYATDYGPFGADGIVLTGGANVSYDFETGDQGWTFRACPGIGSSFGLGDIANYAIFDPCGCAISGCMIRFHDDGFEHPTGQHVVARSNPTDVLAMAALLSGSPGQLQIFADWDQYSLLPRANGVFYRPGWEYYPYECASSPGPAWSGRVGQSNFFYNPGPECGRHRSTATAVGVPSDIEQIRFLFEIYASCDAFGISPSQCTQQTNFTPVLDNVQVRGTKVPAAPVVAFAPSANGTRFQDGFAQSLVQNVNGLGNADVDKNINFGNAPPVMLGDSLFVTGPPPNLTTKWETRLWFKIRREGPGTKPARYTDWKNDAAGIHGNPNPTTGFAYAWMDSFQSVNGTPSGSSFVSYCREDNWYPGESGEFSDGNEIIRDGVLVAGTAIDYFVTANYVTSQQENYFLPDTTGGFFYEFEILPSWRNSGGLKYPCLLYVDACNTGAEPVIEGAFAMLGLAHDRYDYNDASSNWKAPLGRGVAPSNNGLPIYQLMGYRAIVLNTGSLVAPIWSEDFALFTEWLNTNACDGALNRQGMILNGDNIATGLAAVSPAFLSGTLGATHLSNAYHDASGGDDQNYCVQLETPLGGGGVYGTTNSHNPGGYEYDAWGNWCPQGFQFDVMGTTNGGVGNRAYVNIGGGDTDYNQVARAVGGAGNYRVVVDGVSYDHLSERLPIEECEGTIPSAVTAAANEMAAALEWIFSGPQIPSLCFTLFCGDLDVDDDPEISDARVTRLYQNSPNPFNPRTVLRFSLAQTGPARLTIFDVNGRRIRTLVAGPLEAGLHEVVWEGNDDGGHPVASGVFWSQLETHDFRSNKKIVVLK